MRVLSDLWASTIQAYLDSRVTYFLSLQVSLCLLAIMQGIGGSGETSDFHARFIMVSLNSMSSGST